MKTIEEIIEDHVTSDAAPSVETIAELRDDLTAREQEAMDTLRVVASEFGLLPAVVAKVICMLGLGAPCEGEEREHVDAQYAALLAQIEEQRQEAIQKYAQIGIHIEPPEFKDPLAEGLPTGITIPDSPED
jgi:hypothetical protein